jgi:hypothetical protein
LLVSTKLAVHSGGRYQYLQNIYFNALFRLATMCVIIIGFCDGYGHSGFKELLRIQYNECFPLKKVIKKV